MSDLQALEKQFLIDEVETAGVTVLGEQIISMSMPNPDFPAWRLDYRGYDDVVYTLISAGQPVTIKGKHRPPEVPEEVIIEEEE